MKINDDVKISADGKTFDVAIVEFEDQYGTRSSSILRIIQNTKHNQKRMKKEFQIHISMGKMMAWRKVKSIKSVRQVNEKNKRILIRLL